MFRTKAPEAAGLVLARGAMFRTAAPEATGLVLAGGGVLAGLMGGGGALANRFASADATPTDPREDAANAGMFGRMTRTREVWRPDKLVCKRFNVPDPFFGQIAAPKAPVGSGRIGTAFEDMMQQLPGLAPPPLLDSGSAHLALGAPAMEGPKAFGVDAEVVAAPAGSGEAPLASKPPADIFKSIFDDSDGSGSDNDAPAAPAPHAAPAAAMDHDASQAGSLDTMLSFFASKTAATAPVPAARKKRWDQAPPGGAPTYVAGTGMMPPPPTYTPGGGMMPPPSLPPPPPTPSAGPFAAAAALRGAHPPPPPPSGLPPRLQGGGGGGAAGGAGGEGELADYEEEADGEDDVIEIEDDDEPAQRGGGNEMALLEEQASKGKGAQGGKAAEQGQGAKGPPAEADGVAGGWLKDLLGDGG
ncbi:hypothetical protein T484DRAFT_1901786, partial [Baffinella frigidus]